MLLEGRTRRALGYIWDGIGSRCTYCINSAENSFFKRKALRLAGVPLTWYVVLRNGNSPLGHWLTESRDVAPDYRLIFNSDQGPEVEGLALQADTATLGGTSKSRVGSIAFSSDPRQKDSDAESPCTAIQPEP